MPQLAGAEGVASTADRLRANLGATVELSRGWRVAVRGLAVLGLFTFSFMFLFVVSDAAKRAGVEQVLEDPASPEARLGAEHPGEAVHLTGTAAVLVIGAAGLVGLAIRPQRAGSAHHTAAAGLGMLLAVAVVGNPDNHGGQAGVVDPAFLIMAVPPVAAALAARPWRAWRERGTIRPGYLILTVLGLPGIWYGIAQGLVQRNTWPPLADPHHQAHWYAMAVLGFLVVSVLSTATLSGRGWRLAAVLPGVAAVSVAVASFLAPSAASALPPEWATVALLWGLAVLLLTAREMRRPEAI